MEREETEKGKVFVAKYGRAAAGFWSGMLVTLQWRAAAQHAGRRPQQSGTAQAPAPSLCKQRRHHGRQSEQSPESLHVMVGHSLLIRTPSRVKRILTGNPAVIESVLTSPQEVVITAKQTGGSSLMLWEEDGPEPHAGCVRRLDVTPLRNTLDQSFPNSGVEVQSARKTR